LNWRKPAPSALETVRRADQQKKAAWVRTGECCGKDQPFDLQFSCCCNCAVDKSVHGAVGHF
jgi:hypothetical protein